MDEPLSALDKKLREEMQIELKQLHRQLGVTTVYVTHDQREALTMSDRIAIIDHGELTQIGTPREIYNAPANHFVASFIGESSFFPLTKDKSGALQYAGVTVGEVPKGATHDNWTLVIRPERLSLHAPKTSKNNDKIYFSGEITELVYQGETAIVMMVMADGHSLTARMNTRAGNDVDSLMGGQNLLVGIDKKDVIIIPGEAS